MAESGVRGFYSRIDGSAQPYILTMPERYDAAAKREYRLDIFMHGRDDTVLEQQFMTKSTTGYASKPYGAGVDWFMVQPYGRYTNASRFAGEIDGLEAIESVARAYPIDRNRIVMAGFSMGGASAWSYAVHYADRWVAAAPGAGFSETRVFLRGDLAGQPQNAVQQTLWRLYDATDYAVNTFNVPVVAYSGANDGQKQAADAMAAAMLDEGLTLEHVIGPNTGHSYEPGARQQVQDRLDQLARQRPQPGAEGSSLHHVDASVQQDVLGHGGCHGAALGARPGRRSDRRRRDSRDDRRRDGDALRVRARVSRRSPWAQTYADDRWRDSDVAGRRPGQVADGQSRQDERHLEGRRLPAAGLRKTHGLQGPIDDAFMDSFVFVRPTGKAFSDALGDLGARAGRLRDQRVDRISSAASRG